MKRKKIILNTIILILVIATWIKMANSQQWESLGLSDLAIHSIAIDPGNPEIIYVGASRPEIGVFGLFKTLDGGAHWDTLFNKPMDKLIINPKNTNILYGVAGWIYKSEDSGFHWTRSDSGIWYTELAGITSLAIDPKHPDTLYAGTGGLDHNGPFKSIDGGKSWQWIRDEIYLWPSILSILVDKDSTNTIYLGTDWNGDIYKSTNGGESYEKKTGNIWSGGIINILLRSPNDSNILYAGGQFANLDQVFWKISKSIDSGNNWFVADSGITGSLIQAMIIHPHNENILYAGTNTGLFKSTDAGATWLKVSSSSITDSNIQWLSFHPNDLNIIYVGTNKGLYKLTELSDVNLNQYKESRALETIIFQNYPNPFNNNTFIRYYLPEPEYVSIAIYSLSGQLIRSLIHESFGAGYNEVAWNGKDNNDNTVSSGLYFCKIRHNSYTQTMKLILIK